MTRLSRKNRTDIKYSNIGGFFNLMDDSLKEIWRISDEEYDYVCEHASDEELNYFIDTLDNFTKKRQALIILDKLLTKMYL